MHRNNSDTVRRKPAFAYGNNTINANVWIMYNRIGGLTRLVMSFLGGHISVIL